MYFSSENYDGVHPLIMEALAEANIGFTPSYGNDDDTKTVINLLKQEFGEQIEVYFTFNGTGANNFGLACIVERYQSIFCSSIAHCYVDEATAPETFIGCRLYPIPAENGKITIQGLQKQGMRKGDVHHPQAGVVSLSQPTEYGTIYSLEELQAIRAFCIANNLLLHIDGARFFNAAAALNISLKELSSAADVLTLGGTKIGMMFGEAVIFFNPPVNNPYKFVHKGSMQLASKNRFIAIQFQKVIENKLWQELASYTNGLAKYFEQEVKGIPQVQIAYPVQTNVVFLIMPKWLYAKMKHHATFYQWNELKEEVRLVFSFSNNIEEINEFISWLKHYS